jgi:hypothetical protein
MNSLNNSFFNQFFKLTGLNPQIFLAFTEEQTQLGSLDPYSHFLS